MGITYLRSPTVPKNMAATRLAGNPLDGDASVIRRDAAIPVLSQEADGSFRPISTVSAVPTPEMQLTAPLPPDAAESRAKPEYQVPVDAVPAQATGIKESASPSLPESIRTPQPSGAPVQPASSKRVRVKLSNPGMGRVTVSVRAVSISEAVIILAYPQDADNIVEPPVCDSKNAIKVEYEGNTYRCVFGGWTTELEGMFLVILLRDDDEASSQA